MDIKDKIKLPDIKLEPKKEIMEKLPKEDRLPYAVIIGLLLFVVFVLWLRPEKEFDATFWIVIVVIIATSFIAVIHKVAPDKKEKKKDNKKHEQIVA